MVNGRLDSVVRRSAPVITGTGLDSIQQLISALNKNRRQWRRADGVSSEINNDDPELIALIRKAGYTMDSLLERDLSLQLRGNAKLSSGGCGRRSPQIAYIPASANSVRPSPGVSGLMSAESTI